LKGSIPWVWLSAAARLPGRALHVAIELRLWAGIKKTRHFALTISALTDLGVSRSAAYRGLVALEREGLVTIDRRRGRKPRVTVVEIDDNAAADSQSGRGGPKSSIVRTGGRRE
jgi:DNA-binding transcriptional ArsR family regulator